MSNQKKFLYFILTIILIGVVIFCLKTYLIKKYSSKNETTNTTESTSGVAENNFPPGVTEDWIRESNAQIVAKNINTVGGQGTIIYESKLSLKAGATDYEKFLKGLGWQTTLSEVKDVGIFVLNAKKDNYQAQITFDQNDVSKVNTVSINVTQSLFSTEPNK